MPKRDGQWFPTFPAKPEPFVAQTQTELLQKIDFIIEEWWWKNITATFAQSQLREVLATNAALYKETT